MILVKLQGGLGNQLFQYAFARALAHRGFSVGLDASFSYVTLKTLRAKGGQNLIRGGRLGKDSAFWLKTAISAPRCVDRPQVLSSLRDLKNAVFNSKILESQNGKKNKHKLPNPAARDFAPQNSQSPDSKSNAHFLSLRDTAPAVAWQSTQTKTQIPESQNDNTKEKSFRADTSLESAFAKVDSSPKALDRRASTIRDLELAKFRITLPILRHFSLAQDSQADISTQIYCQALCAKAVRKILPPNSKPARLLRSLYTTRDSPKLARLFQARYPFSRNAYFEGFFANAVYFAEIESILRQEFTPKCLSPSAKALQEQIRSTSDSVFLHIRRGDYLAQENWEYVKLGSAYYDTAIALMRKKLKSPSFFIFSDDLEWCKSELYARLGSLKGAELHFIGNNDQGDAISDLMAMAACQNAIIANSTFSFWGAYLIDNPAKLVIRPAQYTWRGDNPLCYPESWITLDVIWGDVLH